MQWNKIDSLYPEFESDPRNLRISLVKDGMNPYGNLSSKHSYVARFCHYLKFIVLVVYEEKIYDVVYDDIRTKKI